MGNHTGPYRIIRDHTGPYGTIRDLKFAMCPYVSEFSIHRVAHATKNGSSQRGAWLGHYKIPSDIILRFISFFDIVLNLLGFYHF